MVLDRRCIVGLYLAEPMLTLPRTTQRRPFMNRVLFRVGCVFLLTAFLRVGPPTAVEAKTQLMPGGIQEVDSETLKELLNTFEQAELAMQAHDLDRIMALYSDDYLYHGLKKAD